MHFMNPVPGHAARGDHPRARHQRRHDGHACVALRNGRSARRRWRRSDYPGFIANRILMPMINEAVYCAHGRRRHRRGDRHRHEARHEPPHGPARPGRPHRARHLPGDPRGAARGAGRSEVPPLPAAAEVRGRRVAGPEDRAAASTRTEPMPWALIPLTEEQRDNPDSSLATSRWPRSRRTAPRGTATRTSSRRSSPKMGELGFLGMMIPEAVRRAGARHAHLSAGARGDRRRRCVGGRDDERAQLAAHADAPALGLGATRRSGTCDRWRAARCWARSRFPSPTPAPTRRRCARRPCATATTGC